MTNPSTPPKPFSVIRHFLQSEAGGGILLIMAAALAMLFANSGSADAYFAFTHYVTGPVLTDKLGPMTVHLWVNDGLMAIFFLLVGLEIKREMIDGRLSSWDKRRLPVVAAIAGMAVPAIFYLISVSGNAALTKGWAIPAATDIAFAIGVLALLGKRAPTSLKLFLVTVAIVDDMGAVAIIALFYTSKINIIALAAAGIILAGMYAINRGGVRHLLVYLLLAVALWYAVLLSGVHATIAGVLAAMTVPIDKTPGAPDSEESPLHKLEHALHPWSSYFIVPLFGFVNAGVSLQGMSLGHLLAPMPLGIAMGLFLGKQIGIFAAVWVAVKTGFAQKLRGATWMQVYGVSILCGIGFTMSLFIGGLAFTDPLLIEEAKIGVLMGSVLSAVIGFLVLRFAPLHPHHQEIEDECDSEIASDGDLRDMEEAPVATTA